MKLKLGNTIAFSLVAMLFLSMMAILPVHAATEIYMDPSVNTFDTDTTTVGYTWTITVWVKDVSDLLSYQVMFNVTDEHVNITNAWVPTADPEWVFAGRGTFEPPAAFFDDDGDGYSEKVLVGSVILAGSTFTGQGKLAVIELKIIAVPPKFGEFDSALNIKNDDTFMQDSTEAVIPTVKTDGSFLFTWSPPATNPYLAVSPTLVEYGPDPINPPVKNYSIGEAFDIELYVKQLDAAWGLTNASFTLSYNSTVIEVIGGTANITVNTVDWDGVNEVSIAAELISLTVRTNKPLGGDILIATITFTVMMQGDSPPLPLGHYDYSNLTFGDILLMDHNGAIPTDPQLDGEVRIYALRTLPIAWLSVEPSDTVLGPELVAGEQFGKEFEITVNMNDLDKAWKVVGVQFRLKYDPALIEPVSIEEGPFMASFPNRPEPPFTFFIGENVIDNPLHGTHVLVGILLLPDDNGTWSVFPEGQGALATIRFKALTQSWETTLSSDLMLFDVLAVAPIPEVTKVQMGAISGTYSVLPIAPVGRRIDLWLDHNAELVIPQQDLAVTAKVTYNWWPVAQKDVAFEIRDNNGNLVAVLSGRTGDDGHTSATFAMPWPNVDPESLLGVWSITASVDISGEVVTQSLEFQYDYLVRVSSVSTDKLEYNHLETAQITVTYGTLAVQSYDIVLYVVIQDELGVPIGIATVTKTIGGSTFGVYKDYTDTLSIVIPQYAYAGAGATVLVNVLDMLPSEGGVAVTPETTTTISILPLP